MDPHARSQKRNEKRLKMVQGSSLIRPVCRLCWAEKGIIVREESCREHAGVAQSGERPFRKREAASSILAFGSNAAMAQMEERAPGTGEVGGSTPPGGSILEGSLTGKSTRLLPGRAGNRTEGSTPSPSVSCVPSLPLLPSCPCPSETIQKRCGRTSANGCGSDERPSLQGSRASSAAVKSTSN